MSRPKKRKGGRVTPKGTGSTRRPNPGDGPGSSGRFPGSSTDPFDGLLDGPFDGSWADELGDATDDIADDEADVLARVGDAVASGHPAELLVLASTFAEAIDDAGRPEPLIPGAADDETLTWSSVVDEFVASVRPETTALLHALAALAPEQWRERIEAELSRRHTPSLPKWIASIGDVEVTGAWVARQVLGDEDDVFIGARWPTGQAMTLIVNIDHLAGSAVADTVVTLRELDAVVSGLTPDDAGIAELLPVDPADARARVQAAVHRWETTVPLTVGEDWPTTRPILQWLLSKSDAASTTSAP